MTNFWAKVTVAIVSIIVLLAVVLMFSTCGHRSDTEPKIPPATQRTLDSLAQTTVEFQRRTDSLMALIGRDTVRVTRIIKHTDTVKVAVRVIERAADSLAKLHEWEGAYKAEKQANDSLHVVVDSLDKALGIEREARHVLFQAFVADTLRRVRTEQVNKDLQKAIAALERPCRVLGPIPCPSRTVTFIGSLGVGAALGILATRGP